MGWSGLGNRKAQHSFAEIPDVHNTRSQFDRSHAVKDTMDFDYLNPIFVDEVIPGDTFNLTLQAFGRLATQLVPIIDNMYIDFFFFFVPNRLIYSNWEKMNGAQDNPGDSTDFICPQLTGPIAPGFTVGSIYDKFGIPTGVASLLIKNCLPFRAYNKIWNDWFRDQNLQNSVTVNLGAGPDANTDYTLLKRGKRHDYFTSCLPFLQKHTAVTLPLGTSAPVKGLGVETGVFGTASHAVRESGGGTPTYANAKQVGTGSADNYLWVQGTAASSGFPNIYADLTAATAATINQLREAFMMQSLFELDARGGTRYVEILRAHFGVISPDFRLQRSEYLGGGEVSVLVHPIAQTSPTSGSNAQGQLASFATASATGKQNIGFTKSFVEHGYIIGLAAARADITYQQGLNRMWNRSTRYDFFWPKLQELGEQAVLNKEIYCDGSGNDDLTFGYQERYAEYRYKPSEIRGKLRSTYSTPLDYWHLAEKFNSLPALNSTFIQSSTPITRALAVNTEPHLIMDFWFNLKCARPMLTYSVPAALGRF